MSQRGSPDGGVISAAKEADALPRRSSLILGGALSAAALGVYSVVGLLGAVLALLPAAVRAEPRGRVPSLARSPAAEPSEASAEVGGEPLAG